MEANKSSKTSSGQQPGSRHIQTEQRRRDRINEGFEALRELVPCKDKKIDKATFLLQVVEYIRSLQETMQQVVAAGGINSLPEDTQWQVRLLLPRRTELTGANREAGGPSSGPQASGSGATGAEGRAMSSGSAGMFKQPSIAQLQQAPLASTSGKGRESHQAAPSDLLGSDPESRVPQLQQLLQQLQAQQAVQQQQLQSQQAAAIQSQMMTAMRIQQLLQQNPQMAANIGLSLDALRLPAAPLANPLAPNPLASPFGLLSNLGLQQMPADQTQQDTSCGTSGTSGTAASQDARGAAKARKATKVRRHTTAAKIPKPRMDPPSSGSEGSRDGRPDLGESGLSDVEA